MTKTTKTAKRPSRRTSSPRQLRLGRPSRQYGGAEIIDRLIHRRERTLDVRSGFGSDRSLELPQRFLNLGTDLPAERDLFARRSRPPNGLGDAVRRL